MEIEKAIVKLEKVLSKEWCQKIAEYTDIVSTEKAKVFINGKEKEDTKERNVYTYSLNSKNTEDSTYITKLIDLMNECSKEYAKTFTYIRQLKIQHINLLKYKKGNFYTAHIDSFHTVNRQLSFIINLNNDYEGGELVFYHPTTNQPYSKVSLKQGDLIMFPSNFLYPHCIAPITKGTRYSIVSWYS